MESYSGGKEEEKKLQVSPPFRLLTGEFPQEIVVSEESKLAFKNGALADQKKWLLMSTDEKIAVGERNYTRGQGFVEVSFKMKRQKKEWVQSESIPCFNKGDGKPRQDKNGVPYEMFDPEKKYTDEQLKTLPFAVEAPEPLGKNTGVVHEHAKKLLKLQKRMSMDIQDKDVWGSGYFKGDDKTLLMEYRFKSANINTKSVEWDREFLLIHYYSEDATKPAGDFDNLNSYFIKRKLPPPVSQALLDAKLSQFDAPDVVKKECKYATIETPEINWWYKNGNDPKAKILGLMYALHARILYGDMNEPEANLVEDILYYIKINDQKLKSQNNSLNLRFKDGETLLTYACKQNKSDGTRIAIQLIEAGASVTQVGYLNETPLSIAIMNENTLLLQKMLENKQVVEYLLQEPDILYNAISHNQIKSIKVLMEHCPSLFEMGTNEASIHMQEKPLIFAAKCGFLGIVKLLLKDDKPLQEVELKQQDEKEDVSFLELDSKEIQESLQTKTELLLLLLHDKNDNNEIVKYLIETDADINARLRGKSTFEMAVEGNKLEIFKMLLKKLKSNLDLESISQPSFIGRMFSKIGLDNATLKRRTLNKILNKSEGSGGNSLLHLAIKNDCVEVISFLLQEGVDPNVLNAQGISPLERSVKMNNPNTTNALLSNDKIDIYEVIRMLKYATEKELVEVAGLLSAYLQVNAQKFKL